MNRRQFLAAAGVVVTAASPMTRAQARTVVQTVATNRADTVVRMESSSRPGTFHEVRQGRDGNIYCSCPAWRFQRKPPMERTCKHLRALATAVRQQVA